MVSRVVVVALVTLLSRASAIELRSEPGALHGFPSMSDPDGHVIADGELTQEVRGDELVAKVRWQFRDGRRAEEVDTFALRPELSQRTFSFVETSGGVERRRFEVDFGSGKASAVVGKGDHPDQANARLELPRGRSFAGYGVALAAGELPLEREGASQELTFVAFTPGPRTVTLEIRRGKQVNIPAGDRSIAADDFTLHPKLPFPVKLFVHPKDAHLWFTHRPPRALVRAEQNLVTKDDPQVVVDVTPRATAAARR